MDCYPFEHADSFQRKQKGVENSGEGKTYHKTTKNGLGPPTCDTFPGFGMGTLWYVPPPPNRTIRFALPLHLRFSKKRCDFYSARPKSFFCGFSLIFYAICCRCFCEFCGKICDFVLCDLKRNDVSAIAVFGDVKLNAGIVQINNVALKSPKRPSLRDILAILGQHYLLSGSKTLLRCHFSFLWRLWVVGHRDLTIVLQCTGIRCVQLAGYFSTKFLRFPRLTAPIFDIHSCNTR